jgi:hypothetical protein
MKRTVIADPSQWSIKSRQSLKAFFYEKEYTDIEYSCWRCRTTALFTAEEQKESFEVKKNHLDQRRILCQTCWDEANALRKDLASCQQRWAGAKKSLQKDKEFLERWLELLRRLEQYVPYRPDTARKNILQKLIRKSLISEP